MEGVDRSASGSARAPGAARVSGRRHVMFRTLLAEEAAGALIYRNTYGLEL